MSRKIICPRCNKITTVDHNCQEKYKDRRKKTQLTNSRWSKIRNEVRRRDLCCFLCWSEGVYVKGEEVHHVKPREVDDSDDNIYNADNCIYLCRYHHHKVHADGWQKYYDLFNSHIKAVKNNEQT